jgi:cardiolipin synthase
MAGLDLTSVLRWALTIVELISIGFVPVVLARRKEPAATFAWIIGLLAFPPFGLILFWYLGRDRVRRPMRTRAKVNARLRQRIADRLGPIDSVASQTRMHTLDGSIFADAPEPLRGVMRLALRAGRSAPKAGNAVTVLRGAPTTYASLVAAIEAAERHVHLEYYAFRADGAGRIVIDALAAAVARGVTVRLLYDGLGSAGLGRKLTKLRASGAQIAPFFPLDLIRRGTTINLRNHRKLAVIDGTVGFAGGINIGDEFVAWRDIHLRIEGPAVEELAAVFVEDWYFATRKDVLEETLLGAKPPGALPGQSVLQIVQSGPDETLEAIQRLYFAAIASARQRVWITTPYFVPDRAVLMALETAAMRGVDVRVLVPAHSNWWITSDAGRSFYDELLGSGVSIYEYLPGMLHTKAMVVDGVFGTVGSANLDVRSFRLNFELVAVLYDPAIVAELESIFREDQAQARQLELDAWRRRPFSARVREGFGRLLTPLL